MGEFMDIEKYLEDRKKNKINDNIDERKIKYLKFLITRILLSIIIVISTCIYIKLDEKNILNIEKYLFNDSLQFTKINSWYQDKVGTLIPSVSDNSSVVSSISDITKNEYVEYLDGVKINIQKNSPVSVLNGGIVVFVGEKENYGNTVILQGNDGIDYWYGGLSDISINLYDYIEKDTLIGVSNNDYIYLVLQKNGEYIKYEEIL